MADLAKLHFPSSPRRRGYGNPRSAAEYWIPAFAGMTPEAEWFIRSPRGFKRGAGDAAGDAGDRADERHLARRHRRGADRDRWRAGDALWPERHRSTRIADHVSG